MEERLVQFQEALGQLIEEPEDPAKLPEPPSLPALRQKLAEATKLRAAMDSLPGLVQKDLKEWIEKDAKKNKAQDKTEDKATDKPKDKPKDETKGKPKESAITGLSMDLENAKRSLESERGSLATADARLAAIEKALSPQTRIEQYGELVRWTRELLQMVQDLSLVQARSRLEGVEGFAELTLTSEEG
jgi:hypothetical protein